MLKGVLLMCPFWECCSPRTLTLVWRGAYDFESSDVACSPNLQSLARPEDILSVKWVNNKGLEKIHIRRTYHYTCFYSHC